ncbi:MAG: hypothetical protein K9N46_10110 [Candidatus Marinimicrobia bacterium]|nr:hypothetical protein [Candidatus Neomarinimicrobiota bacterium]MCF7829269.1 hypothetical protein [Candidatus Neomarinimicrobiota bacterium]MCF7881078.1 hypothetical protein [Candidatus Neomarinimicrobiota bacterium]
MSYTIYVSENGQYIILTVQGTMTRELGMEQNMKAHALGRKEGIHRYLVDVREARNEDPVLKSYKFAHKDMLDNPTIDESAVVALLTHPDDDSHDFIETVSRNAGFNVTKFTSEKEAVDYLLNHDSDS